MYDGASQWPHFHGPGGQSWGEDGVVTGASSGDEGEGPGVTAKGGWAQHPGRQKPEGHGGCHSQHHTKR